MGVKQNGSPYDYLQWIKRLEVEKSKELKKKAACAKKEEMKNSSAGVRLAFWFKYYFFPDKYYISSYNPFYVGDKSTRIRLVVARSFNHAVIKFHKRYSSELILKIERGNLSATKEFLQNKG